MRAFFLPAAGKRSEGGFIQNVGNGRIDTLPDVGERIVGLGARVAFDVFNSSEDFADCDGVWGAGEQIPAFRAAAGINEAVLLQSGKDELEKLLRYLLTLGDVGDFDGRHGPTRLRCGDVLRGEIEDSLERILALDRDVHPESTNDSSWAAAARGQGSAPDKMRL